MLDQNYPLDQIVKFETILNDYFVEDPIDVANKELKRLVEEINSWVRSTDERTKSAVAELEEKKSHLDGLREEVDSIGADLKKMAAEGPDVDVYNALVAVSNEKVEHLKGVMARYNDAVNELNQQQQENNRVGQQREEQYTADKAVVHNRIEEYKKWEKNEGPLNFFNEINKIFADLVMERKEGINEHHEAMRRLGYIRSVLGTKAKKKYADNFGKMLLEEVKISEETTNFMVVDTGATSCCLTEEMVVVLGLEDNVGGEVEVTLPNAIKIKAKELLIPEMTVQGVTAQFVRGLVMDVSDCGVDGSLGLSFLSKFDYTIENEGLSLKERVVVQTQDNYDVFICHNSEDFEYAKKVYDTISNNGGRAFLSDISIRGKSSTDYMNTIDEAIEGARHLVIIASSVNNIKSPWVKSEWQMFLHLKRKGLKQGNILPIFFEGMDPDDLPVSLISCHVVNAQNQGWDAEILEYLK